MTTRSGLRPRKRRREKLYEENTAKINDSTVVDVATRTLLKTDVGITRLHGKRFVRDGMVFVPLFHPAAALHKPPLKATLIEDFQLLKAYLEEGREAVGAGARPETAAGANVGAEDGPGAGDGGGRAEGTEHRQLGLF